MAMMVVVCNGIDDSLLGVDLAPFEYGIASEDDKKSIEELKWYCIGSKFLDTSGNIISESELFIVVDNLFDLIRRVFSHSLDLMQYLDVIKVVDGSTHKERQRFRYFTSDGESDSVCLLHAVRLFKTNNAGFGRGILMNKGHPGIVSYPCETSSSLRDILLPFTLDDSEKVEFQKFYVEFREWYLKKDVGSKDRLTKIMLNLFRNAYRCSDVEMAFITLSGIWEMFAQYFPMKKSRKGSSGITERIMQSVSRMVRNSGMVTGKDQDNLYKKVGYLYKQRSIIIHKKRGKSFDYGCVFMAFDITRCLILKLVYANDENIEDVVYNLEKCDEDKAAYKMNRVKLTPVDDELLERIFKST